MIRIYLKEFAKGFIMIAIFAAIGFIAFGSV